MIITQQLFSHLINVSFSRLVHWFHQTDWYHSSILLIRFILANVQERRVCCRYWIFVFAAISISQSEQFKVYDVHDRGFFYGLTRTSTTCYGLLSLNFQFFFAVRRTDTFFGSVLFTRIYIANGNQQHTIRNMKQQTMRFIITKVGKIWCVCASHFPHKV